MHSKTVTHLPIAVHKFDLATWFFGLSNPTYLAASRAHLGLGSFTDEKGRRGSISIEEAAGVLMIHYYYEVKAEPDRLCIMSVPYTQAWFLRLIPIRFSVSVEMMLQPRTSTETDLVFNIDIAALNPVLNSLLNAWPVRAMLTASLTKHNLEETAAFARDIMQKYQTT